ncbi:hypothetical protein EJB05_50469 [Eragrostis curvula]|uniref:Uncharacterized protein n=1 Tax=Eragrostis curvula TaxID=38414 RepID=A0A5J9SY86_9POAL|nr:hypothetical protein EJB05_50469 [Eragrostis curvula]
MEKGQEAQPRLQRRFSGYAREPGLQCRSSPVAISLCLFDKDWPNRWMLPQIIENARHGAPKLQRIAAKEQDSKVCFI